MLITLAAPFNQDETHYNHVNSAIAEFQSDLQAQTDNHSIRNTGLDKTAQIANKFLRTYMQVCDDDSIKHDCAILRNYIETGTYSRLPKTLKTLSQEYKNNRMKIKEESRIIANRLSELVEIYHNTSESAKIDFDTPAIIISETFI